MMPPLRGSHKPVQIGSSLFAVGRLSTNSFTAARNEFTGGLITRRVTATLKLLHFPADMAGNDDLI
jgi:hypothetical protein